MSCCSASSRSGGSGSKSADALADRISRPSPAASGGRTGRLSVAVVLGDRRRGLGAPAASSRAKRDGEPARLPRREAVLDEEDVLEPRGAQHRGGDARPIAAGADGG